MTTRSGAWRGFYAPGELLAVACLACAGRRTRDVAHEFGIAVARCEACGLVFTRTPLPASQAHYARSDASAAEAKYGRILRGEAPHPRDRNYVEHLRTIERHQPPGALLDVGSHCGFFLRKARDRGWSAVGVEPSPVTSTLARERFGLDVVTGTLAEAGFPDRAFDTVTLVDVFEHVDRPNALLADVRRVLRPSGLLFVKVPDVRYVVAEYTLTRQLLLRLAAPLDARKHLACYSDRTLGSILRRNGFEVAALRVPSPIQTGGSVGRAPRASGPAVAHRLAGGTRTPLATDLVALARPAGCRPPCTPARARAAVRSGG